MCIGVLFWEYFIRIDFFKVRGRRKQEVERKIQSFFLTYQGIVYI